MPSRIDNQTPPRTGGGDNTIYFFTFEPMTPTPDKLAEAREKPQCTHDDCLRDGPRGACLERQQRFLVENWRKYIRENYRIAMPSESAGHYLAEIEVFIPKLLEAADLVSRAEQKNKFLKIIDHQASKPHSESEWRREMAEDIKKELNS